MSLRLELIFNIFALFLHLVLNILCGIEDVALDILSGISEFTYPFAHSTRYIGNTLLTKENYSDQYDDHYFAPAYVKKK